MKKIIRNFLISHVVIILLMLIYFKEMTLLSYINASFIIGGVLTFLGLVSFIFSTGFFDVFTVSMRKVVTSKHRMDDMMAMRKPSEIFSGNVSPMLGSGALILIAMGIGLLLFYI
ncbi:DUF3899 domain-containing protein [Sporosarcina sp. JAI121]|uniref:DUF3899 domain-containing protein n=1 Tax=Sporosarcina sp. JAI121 TaxID=2723064 RepID=UPI0015CE4FAE|nr:DUF3899 domain-containing protein [Sporosarcina sp. JAI121]NYF23988.1 hypothetical protein [Sporosarcina sp. JAI121]